MSIVGIGVDLVEIDRIEAAIARHGDRFLARIFTEEERSYCARAKRPGPCYAARFAAKEAVSKAFGTGIGERLSWQDIRVERRASGCPVVVLSGAGGDLARELGIDEVLLSISHSEKFAVAQAVAVGPNKTPQ